jgi:hypothetical protein
MKHQISDEDCEVSMLPMTTAFGDPVWDANLNHDVT